MTGSFTRSSARWSLTAFDSPDSVAIAQAIATRKGPLQLPNLEKISPRTLAALLQKEDVEIPLGDLLATLAAAVGVKPATENLSEMGRPIKIAEGKPVAAVLA